MLEILKELGLSEEMAKKVMEAFDKFLAENAEKEEEKGNEQQEKENADVKKTQNEEKEEKKEKAKIPPVGKADEDIPSKQEFEKMGYLARLELAKKNPEAYERLKSEK